MPMTFTVERLRDYAEMIKADPQGGDESEVDFRKRIAEHPAAAGDGVEAMEILTGKPWNEWGRADVQTALERFPHLRRNPAVLGMCLRFGVSP